jgi:hypothetical protein
MKILDFSFIWLLFSTVFSRRAKVLTDETFEHDTQAISGSTTGDWLVLFCEPNRFEECQEIMPMWDEISSLLAGQVNVAFVDV